MPASRLGMCLGALVAGAAFAQVTPPVTPPGPVAAPPGQAQSLTQDYARLYREYLQLKQDGQPEQATARYEEFVSAFRRYRLLGRVPVAGVSSNPGKPWGSGGDPTAAAPGPGRDGDGGATTVFNVPGPTSPGSAPPLAPPVLVSGGDPPPVGTNDVGKGNEKFGPPGPPGVGHVNPPVIDPFQNP